jgi:hypothetical protein
MTGNRKDGVIARTRQWVLIERPGEGENGWMNIWLSARSSDVLRKDFLISFNVRTGSFSDCPAWKKLNTGYPDMADWATEAVRKRYRLRGD